MLIHVATFFYVGFHRLNNCHHIIYFVALLCPSPSLPEHASRTINDSVKYYYGENVMFLCEYGYNLKGSGISYCDVNSSNLTVWNYDSQRCEGILSK